MELGAKKCQIYAHFPASSCMTLHNDDSPAEPLFMGIIDPFRENGPTGQNCIA
jgi:hypothetical protein